MIKCFLEVSLTISSLGGQQPCLGSPFLQWFMWLRLSFWISGSMAQMDFWQHIQNDQHLEVKFHLWGIMMDDTKYYHVVVALDSFTTSHALGLLRDPPMAGNCAALKGELPCHFWLSNASFSKFSAFCPLSAWTTASQLALLSSRNASFLFVQFFLRQLPPTVHISLASSSLV